MKSPIGYNTIYSASNLNQISTYGSISSHAVVHRLSFDPTLGTEYRVDTKTLWLLLLPLLTSGAFGRGRGPDTFTLMPSF